jgi:superfamily II DNA or RNA helicase
MEFRPYQKEIINEGSKKLSTNSFLYLAMEVRTGKTLTAMGICEEIGVSHVLFLTKKKAMDSISKDYDLLCPNNFSI